MVHPGGRPTKLTERFLDATRAVLFKNINAIIHTDEDLLEMINELLNPEERICTATFENWKAKNKEDNEEILDQIGRQFLGLIKKALREQKTNLFNSMTCDDKAWQRWAWIIERKFGDWNIKQRVEHSGGVDVTSHTTGMTKEELEKFVKDCRQIDV